MSTVVGVVVFPGTNCEMDAVEAVDGLGGTGRLLWHGDDDLSGVDAVIVPGGFAHGDYLRPGAIARFSSMMGAVLCALAALPRRAKSTARSSSGKVLFILRPSNDGVTRTLWGRLTPGGFGVRRPQLS